MALIYVAQAVLTVVVQIIVLLLSPLIPLFQQLGPNTFDILMEEAPRRFAHRHDALFRTLSRHPKIAYLQIHVRGLDRYQL